MGLIQTIWYGISMAWYLYDIQSPTNATIRAIVVEKPPQTTTPPPIPKMDIPTTPQMETPTIQSQPNDLFNSLMESKMMMVLVLIFISTAIFVVYLLSQVTKALTKISQTNTNNNNDVKAPTIYNTNNSIHIWLNQVEEYLNAKQITSDKDKQKTILDKLDKTTRDVINDLIKQKKIKNFRQMEDHLKSLYGPAETITSDHILLFAQRKQQHGESLAQFYKALVELANKAFPNTPQATLDDYIKEQFITGLENQTIIDQLLFEDNKGNKNSLILSKAVTLQNTLARKKPHNRYGSDNGSSDTASNISHRSNRSVTFSQEQHTTVPTAPPVEDSYNGNRSNTSQNGYHYDRHSNSSSFRHNNRRTNNNQHNNQYNNARNNSQPNPQHNQQQSRQPAIQNETHHTDT